MMIARFARGS